MTIKNYRCCFTDGNDRVLRSEPINGTDDASAVLQVERLLATTSYDSVELWDGHRLVSKWATVARRSGVGGSGLSAAPAE